MIVRRALVTTGRTLQCERADYDKSFTSRREALISYGLSRRKDKLA